MCIRDSCTGCGECVEECGNGAVTAADGKVYTDREPVSYTHLHQSWVKNGSREQGNWKEMFGSFGAELCSAWAVARYIDEIAAGGKEIYDIFMYTNVWTVSYTHLCCRYNN